MRIAVDARELCGKPTGVGRYLLELLTEWQASPEADRHEWILYAHERPGVPSAYAGRVCHPPMPAGCVWSPARAARGGSSGI